MATDQELVQVLWALVAQPTPQPWCSIHQCAPHDCFRIHYPHAFRQVSVPASIALPEVEAEDIAS